MKTLYHVYKSVSHSKSETYILTTLGLLKN